MREPDARVRVNPIGSLQTRADAAILGRATLKTSVAPRCSPPRQDSNVAVKIQKLAAAIFER